MILRNARAEDPCGLVYVKSRSEALFCAAVQRMKRLFEGSLVLVSSQIREDLVAWFCAGGRGVRQCLRLFWSQWSDAFGWNGDRPERTLFL